MQCFPRVTESVARESKYHQGNSAKSPHESMKSRRIQLIALFVLATLMFLASGLHGSYFCVSPWAGQGPIPSAPGDARP